MIFDLQIGSPTSSESPHPVWRVAYKLGIVGSRLRRYYSEEGIDIIIPFKGEIYNLDVRRYKKGKLKIIFWVFKKMSVIYLLISFH